MGFEYAFSNICGGNETEWTGEGVLLYRGRYEPYTDVVEVQVQCMQGSKKVSRPITSCYVGVW